MSKSAASPQVLFGPGEFPPDDGRFYVRGDRLYQSAKAEPDGSVTVTCSSPICRSIERGDQGALVTIAHALNSNRALLAALINAERLFHHTFAMDGTIHKQMKAAIAEAQADAR